MLTAMTVHQTAQIRVMTSVSVNNVHLENMEQRVIRIVLIALEHVTKTLAGVMFVPQDYMGMNAIKTALVDVQGHVVETVACVMLVMMACMGINVKQTVGTNAKRAHR